MDAGGGSPKLNTQEAAFSKAVVCGKDRASEKKAHLSQLSPFLPTLHPHQAPCPQGDSEVLLLEK